MTFAAGLAAQGHRPFCAIYSTFLQRAYDQVVHDVAIQNLPVRFAMDRAGLVGADGATHAGSFDLAYLCTLPNFVVMAAADEAELCHMVHTMALHDSGPIAVRYPRGEGAGVALPEVPQALEIGKGRIVREGKKVAILSLGTRLEEAEKAADQLDAMGLSTTVADLRFAKPLDEELIRKLLTTHEVAVTIEEAAIGGLGAHVLTLASDEGLIDAGLKLRTMRLPDRFQEHDKPEKQYDEAGLNAAAHRRDGAEGAARQQRRRRGGAGVAKVRADQLLVTRGLAESRTRAQALIMAGAVFSGERKIAKAGDMLAEDAPLEVRGQGPSLGVARRDQARPWADAFRVRRDGRGGARCRLVDRRLHRRAAQPRARRRSMRSTSAPTSWRGSCGRTRASSSMSRPTRAT